MNAFGWIFISGLSMSGIALAGAVIFLLGEEARQRIILPLVAFSAGSLMGGAFLHMIPEAVIITNGDFSMYIEDDLPGHRGPELYPVSDQKVAPSGR